MNLREKIEYYIQENSMVDAPYTQSCEIMLMVKEYIQKFMDKEFEVE